jgi:hypothetical protein
MPTCCIRYTIDRNKAAEFAQYARSWPAVIARCGGALIGYFLPQFGADNFALALIDFPSMAEYERYRATTLADPEALENFAFARRTQCILVEDRCFLERT